jgi:pyruvate formate lyase activating enzyme
MSDGTVFDIRRYSTHDGPGIRTSVFLKGCPLSCRWCHNPESRSFEIEESFRRERCLGCGACKAADWRYTCPSDARLQVGRKMSAPEVLAELRKDIDFYDESGGGASFSGGEPLSQPEFLRECLALCREAGIRTAVDTSGWASRETLELVAPLTDLFLYDLKLVDPQRHRRWTGVSSGPILDNLAWLASSGAQVWMRLPLIPGVNIGVKDPGDMRDMEAAADFIASLGRDFPVFILPYHEAARGKYSLRGEVWEGGLFRIPEEGDLESVEKIFADRGMRVRLGG